MPFVLDASVTMSWCFTDEQTDYSRSVLDALRESWAEVPALWHFEIANVLLISERRGRLTVEGSQAFLEMLSRLDIRVDSESGHLGNGEHLSLARRCRLTAYDAAYLELAQRKNLPLATLDRELIAAASRERIALMHNP